MELLTSMVLFSGVRRHATCQARLDITRLNPGIYFIRATHSDGRREVVEFVKAPSTRR